MGCIKIASSSSYDRRPIKSPPSVSIFTKSSSSKYDRNPCCEVPLIRGNPDPASYNIKDFWIIGRYLVLHINYPDCNNYEGNKILVFRDVTLRQLNNQHTIDPHFSNNKKFHSPIARFEPTLDGLRNAKLFAKMLTNQ